MTNPVPEKTSDFSHQRNNLQPFLNFLSILPTPFNLKIKAYVLTGKHYNLQVEARQREGRGRVS